MHSRNLLHKDNINPIDENYKKHGLWVIHDKDGKGWYRENYVHGTNHGIYESFHVDGSLMTKGSYKMGKCIGFLISYNISREIRLVAFYAR